MWKVSDNWICKPKLHTKIKLDGTVVGINEITITKTIDFRNSTITSSAGNQIGKITNKNYISNPNRYEENIMIIDWKGWGKYSTIITHDLKSDEYWSSKSSGWGSSDRVVYSSHAQCFAID